MRNILFIGFLFFSSSCAVVSNTALKQLGILDEQVVLKSLPCVGKEIVFVGMMHVAKPEFYEAVKHKMDSLQNEGFVVFYEGGKLNINSEKKINAEDSVYYWKFRKLMGIDPMLKYSQIEPFSTFVAKYRLVDQPDYTVLGVRPDLAYSTDIPLREMINEYERRAGVIQLDSCDYATPFGSQQQLCHYESMKAKKIFTYDIVLDYRNQHIVKEIKASHHPKIVLIYGKKHYDGVKQLLLKSQ